MPLSSSELATAFGLYDTDRSQTINAEDLPRVLQCLGLGPRVISFDEVCDMQRGMDPSASGRISFAVFERVLNRQLEEMGAGEEQWNAFRIFDKHYRGVVTLTDLEEVAATECQALTNEECRFVLANLCGGANRLGLTLEEFQRATTAALAAGSLRKP